MEISVFSDFYHLFISVYGQKVNLRTNLPIFRLAVKDMKPAYSLDVFGAITVGKYRLVRREALREGFSTHAVNRCGFIWVAHI